MPRTTRTTRTLAQSRSLGRVFAATPPDPRRRRALGLCPKGGLRNGLPVQASLDRIPLLGLDLAAEAMGGTPLPSGGGTLAAGTATYSLSRTLVSEQDSMEQACLQNGGRRSSPGTPRRTGRREASRTARCHGPRQGTAQGDSRSWFSCFSWLEPPSVFLYPAGGPWPRYSVRSSK